LNDVEDRAERRRRSWIEAYRAASASRGRRSASGWVGLSWKEKLVCAREADAPIVLRR